MTNMDQINHFDNGRDIDWGRTSEEYALYRPGPSQLFYKSIQPYGIGLEGQRILDQGTGTGVLARQFAKQGCEVFGTDISENQIRFAKELAKKDGASVSFAVASAETQPFEDDSFDVITASQCYHYFPREKWIPEVHRLLRTNGTLLLTYFAWIPLEDEISRASEELVLKYNPDWTAHSWNGRADQGLDWTRGFFSQTAFLIHDERITFSLDKWCGRMRALRGIGATLSQEQVNAFDQEHRELLLRRFGDSFTIPHRTVTRILKIE